MQGALFGAPFFCDSRKRLCCNTKMDRVAAFVDAGYVLATGGHAVVGRKVPRRELLLDCEVAIRTIGAKAKEVAGLPLLRVYWYDGTESGPTSQQRALAECEDTKLRLGFVRKSPGKSQQKGVDSLLVTDMITLARNGAAATCVLVAGDADLLVAVQQAQEHGVRVHVLGIRAQERGNVASLLVNEADQVHYWDGDTIGGFLACVPHLRAEAPANAGEVLEWAAAETANVFEALPNFLNRIHSRQQEGRRNPPDVDARLLGLAGSAMDARLTEEQQEELRERFRQRVAQAAAGRERGVE